MDIVTLEIYWCLMEGMERCKPLALVLSLLMPVRVAGVKRSSASVCVFVCTVEPKWRKLQLQKLSHG